MAELDFWACGGTPTRADLEAIEQFQASLDEAAKIKAAAPTPTVGEQRATRVIHNPFVTDARDLTETMRDLDRLADL